MWMHAGVVDHEERVGSRSDAGINETVTQVSLLRISVCGCGKGEAGRAKNQHEQTGQYGTMRCS